MNLAQLIGEQQLRISALEEALAGRGIDLGAPDESAGLKRHFANEKRALHAAITDLQQIIELRDQQIDDLRADLLRAGQTITTLKQETAQAREVNARDTAEPPRRIRQRAGSIAYRMVLFLQSQRRPVRWCELRAQFPEKKSGALSSSLNYLTTHGVVCRSVDEHGSLYAYVPET